MSEKINMELGVPEISADELAAVVSKLEGEEEIVPKEIIFPNELEDNGADGKLYGYIREETGISVVFGYDGAPPIPELNTVEIGAVGEDVSYGVKGIRNPDGNGIEFVFIKDGKTYPLKKKGFELVQNLFSRNSGLMESDWLKDKCAIIAGVGSVGSLVAMQLARSGVGNFVLMDADVMEIHNVCRHQCNLTDAGRYKVDAVKDKILQINPNAKVKTFVNILQNVPEDEYSEYLNENSIMLVFSDNRLGHQFGNDLAYHYNIPFLEVCFWERASVGEVFICLPERGDKCYGCSLEGMIKESLKTYNERNHFYVGQETTVIEPGITADIEYVTTLGTKLVLDILNRNNDSYTTRLLDGFTQYTLVCNTNNPELAGEMASKLFVKPLEIKHIIPLGKDDCKTCCGEDSQ